MYKQISKVTPSSRPRKSLKI